MNWYLAKIIFRIVCGEGQHTPQFDEQLRLISAASPEQALQKARSIGRNEQEILINENKRMVEWQFIDVAEMYRISALIDGAELYSRVYETPNADEYIDSVNRRAEHLALNTTHKHLELL